MTNTATEAIFSLLDYAEAKGLIYPIDRAYYQNKLLDIMDMDAPEEITREKPEIPEGASQYLAALKQIAVEKGIIKESAEQGELFCARVMGALTPEPSVVREKFAKYARVSPKSATDWFYKLCRDCDYIKVADIARNERFFAPSPCGDMEITINLSKPEKDPRDIAAARARKQAGYPKCMLCIENPGYAGRPGFPARQNHRVIPVTIDGGQWYLQYSPYLYYDEHCIVFNENHVPMRINHDTFVRLFDFVGQFPHYFLGSNADLPIVGGSILSHDHFQGGAYRFPMDAAGVKTALKSPITGVEACVADWPMTCVRLRGEDKNALIAAADDILNAWRGYSDPARGIFAETDGEKHNTITPILRIDGARWKLDLVLRNNLATPEHPLGVFHPHEDLHHIKKENIGLIEVMGLFILPGRLVSEFALLGDYLTGKIPVEQPPAIDSPISKHYEWVKQLAARYGANHEPAEAQKILRAALSDKCARVLADAGVFKDDSGAPEFLATLGYSKS